MSNEKKGINKFDVNRDEVRIKVNCFKSVDELIAAGKENGIILSFEMAQRIFRKMRVENTRLSDDELGLVSGGGIELVNGDDIELAVNGVQKKIIFF